MGLKQLLGLAKPREALLLPDYALLYPDLPPGVWINARNVADRLRRTLTSRQPPWPGQGPRLLPDEHFRFRDGQPPFKRLLGSHRLVRERRQH
jgi:hypothetical protein